MFDTETMAELCVKQGVVAQAIDIYRRLAVEATDPQTRGRYEARMRHLERGDQDGDPEPLSTPGLRVARRGDEVEIHWQLPSGVRAPALQVLILRRTARGIEAEPRTIQLEAASGHTVVAAPNLYAVRAAAGRIDGGTFVPMARLA